MITLTKPSEAEVIAYSCANRDAPFSYAEVGATRDTAPVGFSTDHHRVLLGRGAQTYHRAKLAIRAWRMFPSPMTELFWPDKPIEEGTLVAILARGAGLWTLNPCRIVYVVDDHLEQDATRILSFGFAYGTLPDHIECGEERFLVEWNRETDEVWYDLFAFSRPQQLLAQVGQPIVRRAQARFRQLSGEAMQAATLPTKLSPENVSTAECVELG